MNGDDVIRPFRWDINTAKPTRDAPRYRTTRNVSAVRGRPADADWVKQLRPYEIKNVSVPRRRGTYLAAEAPKTNYSFTPSWWGDEEVTKPMRGPEAREALALAVRLSISPGQTKPRRRFARALGSEPAMKKSWFRSLILELKR
jgi:hypothetical protein